MAKSVVTQLHKLDADRNAGLISGEDFEDELEYAMQGLPTFDLTLGYKTEISWANVDQMWTEPDISVVRHFVWARLDTTGRIRFDKTIEIETVPEEEWRKLP